MLTSTRNFLLTALLGILVALAAAMILRGGAGASDSAPVLLGAIITGAGLAMFSLVPPALRMLLRGWARVGVGPRRPDAARRLADLASCAVWALWLVGGIAVLPAAWAPLLANLATP
jgi:hypothetical protein